MDKDQRTDFGIKLYGDLDGVDANTLIGVLGNISLAIHQINDDIQSNKSLKINIKHLKPGCYDIFLSIKETLLDAIFQHIVTHPTTAAAEIVVILSALFGLRQFLQGKKPQKVEKEKDHMVVVRGDGNKLNVENKTYNIYIENQVVDTAIGKAFDTLNEDAAIDGIDLYGSEEKKLCHIPREDFERMALPAASVEKETRIKPEEAILTVFKVVFEKGYKWQFYYQGNKISASIKDESFYAMIDQGKKFSKGDKLIVDLEIEQVFDKTLQTYINEEYTISKIKQHIARGEQYKLFE